MLETTWRSRAWGVSVAAHAAVGALMVVALGSGHHHRHAFVPPPPTRLIWVEPAPPPLGGPGPPPPEPAPPVPAPVSPPAVVAPPKPVAKAPTLARTGRAKPIQRPVPVPAPQSPPAEAAASAVSPPPAVGAIGGSSRGVPGGMPGGLGEAPLPLSSVATPPELLERVVPEYPARARNLEIEGQVVLEVVLDRSGRPEPDIRVLKSVSLLDAAAVAAVRQWRFRPARDADGHAVRVVMEVPVRFMLR